MAPETESRLSSLVDSLRIAVACGDVWNARYQEIKFSVSSILSNSIWREKELDVLLGMAKLQPFNEKLQACYYGKPSSIGAVPHFRKKVEKAFKGEKVPEQVQAFLARWVPIWELFEEAKPLIKKGRKVERDVESVARTLEHTGTCPVCMRNVKLNDKEGLVDHGFSLEWEQRTGSCFGVSFPPLETSSFGAEKYLENLKLWKIAKEEALARWSLEGLEGKEYINSQNAKINLGYEIAHLGREIETFERRVEKWTPETLPGVVAGFSK